MKWIGSAVLFLILLSLLFTAQSRSITSTVGNEAPGFRGAASVDVEALSHGVFAGVQQLMRHIFCHE